MRYRRRRTCLRAILFFRLESETYRYLARTPLQACFAHLRSLTAVSKPRSPLNDFPLAGLLSRVPGGVSLLGVDIVTNSGLIGFGHVR